MKIQSHRNEISAIWVISFDLLLNKAFLLDSKLVRASIINEAAYIAKVNAPSEIEKKQEVSGYLRSFKYNKVC